MKIVKHILKSKKKLFQKNVHLNQELYLIRHLKFQDNKKLNHQTIHKL